MRQSNFTDETKHKIILEQIQDNLTVREICNKYNITPGTFYIWKKAITKAIQPKDDEKLDNKVIFDPIEENKTLRRLYINLSAHNYELAKFLEKH